MIFHLSDVLKRDTTSDKELVRKILETSSFSKKRTLQECIYVRYADKVFYRCMSIVKNAEIAKDLTHDIFIKIFTKLHSYKGDAYFHSWVMAVTYNHCITWLTKEKKLPTASLADLDTDPAEDRTEEEERELLDLRLHQLEQLLPRLKDWERLVLMMHYQEGMSVKEMAEVLSISVSAAKMRLKRSRDSLTALFKKLK